MTLARFTLALLIGALASGCTARNRRAPEIVRAGPLPSLFRGVNWATTPAQLAILFRDAEIFRTEWTCLDGSACLSFGTTTDGWAGFGNAMLTVSGPEGSPADLVTLTALNPAPECETTYPDGPEQCLRQPGAALDAVANRMKAELQAQLGPGTDVPEYSSGVAHGYQRDPREWAVRWKRDGYQLTLAVGAEEFGWSAELSAWRGAADPLSPL